MDHIEHTTNARFGGKVEDRIGLIEDTSPVPGGDEAIVFYTIQFDDGERHIHTASSPHKSPQPRTTVEVSFLLSGVLSTLCRDANDLQPCSLVSGRVEDNQM